MPRTTPRPEEPSQGYRQAVYDSDQFRASLWSAKIVLEGGFPGQVAAWGFPGGRITENGREGAELGPGEGHDRHVIPAMKIWVDAVSGTTFAAALDSPGGVFWARITKGFNDVEIVSNVPSDSDLSRWSGRSIGGRDWWNDIPMSPCERRLLREEQIAIAETYLNGLETARANGIPFAPACERFENGVQVTNNPALSPRTAAGCGESMSSLDHIAKVRDRRYPVAAYVNGAGYLVALTLGDVPGGPHLDVLSSPPVTRELPRMSLRMAHIFEFDGPTVTRVHTLSQPAEVGATSGWPSGS